MAVKYERIVEEDLNLGTGTVDVTMPGGGTAVGHRIGPQTFAALAAIMTAAGQTITGGAAAAIVQFTTAVLNTLTWWDVATYKFTPTVDGVYQIDVALTLAAFTGTATLAIRKNGTVVVETDEVRTAAAAKMHLSATVELNGTTDYVTVTVEHNDGTNGRAVTTARVSSFIVGKAA